jgi:hypothetical protein
MQAQSSSRSENEREDKRTQRALLALLLHEFPAQISREDLGFFGFGRGKSLQRAIENLDMTGLVWCEGPFVLPTLAARHFDWLELS